MGKIKLYTGDNKLTLTFTIKDKDGNAISLTGYSSVKFQIAKPNDTTLYENGTCTVTDAANGVCTYETTSTTHAVPTEYECKIRITFSSGKVISARAPNIEVAGDFPTT